MNKVIGNTVGLPNPRTDWSQSDKTKADYLKNKEELKKELDGKADALILESEKATRLVLTDTKEAPLVDYKIYGDSTQDGTPTPDNPVDVVSAGELVTDDTDVNYGRYKIPVKAYGKNIANPLTAKMDYIVYSGTITNNYDGSIAITAGANTHSGRVNLRANNSYTFVAPATVTISCAGVMDDVTLHALLTKKGETIAEPDYIVSSTNKSVTLSVSKGDKIRLFIHMIAGGKLTKDITIYPQMEFGEVATEYEPYVETVYNIYLDEPLRKIDNYQDYIDFGRGVVVRNIGEKTIKETDSLLKWNIWTSDSNASTHGLRVMLNASGKKNGSEGTTLGYFNMGKTSQTIVYTSKKNTLSTWTTGNEVYWHLDYTLLGLDGSEDKDTATAVLKEWVANLEKQGIKIYFNYVLEKPTETPITDFPEIFANYPTTTIVCDGEAQVTYKVDTTNAYNNLKSELDTLKQAIISLGGNL